MTDSNIKTINVHELKNRMESDSELCLIDVREQKEWEEIHISRAILIPKAELGIRIKDKVSNKNLPIYLYCKGGVRSLFAAQSLMDLGYKEVYSVDGGIMQWISSGYPVE